MNLSNGGREFRLLSGEKGAEGYIVQNRDPDESIHSGSSCYSDTVASGTFPLWKDMSVSMGSWLHCLRVPVHLLQELCAVDTAPGYVAGAHQFGLSQNSHLVLPFNQSDVRKR